ncbi:fumarylacetoacetate hydrolase family protein [Sphingobium sp. MK2]|uniref:fumarylacetoacetate hydrolase family protein n=1 Tax=Sphingobium sp. MK2 TaxID=3116540 RepID=UPI0032E35C8B
MRIVGMKTPDGVKIAQAANGQYRPIAPIEAFWSDPVAAAANAQEGQWLDDVDLAPAIPATGRVICVGLNYRLHAEEGGMPIPEIPVVFARWAQTLIPDGAPSPAMAPTYDWEAELGVVIGKAGLAISEADANDHVYGYCSFNDLSCRAIQLETPQWALGKNSDASGPIGAIVTRDEAGDPADGWKVVTEVNGEVVQNGDTSDFIFTVPQVIAFVSRAMTLRPGDLIITGTPSGVGMAMKPPRFLQPGDVVKVEVGPLGPVTTPIVARP